MSAHPRQLGMGLAAMTCLALGSEAVARAADVSALPPLPRLEQKAAAGARAYRAGDALVLENERVRVVCPRGENGYPCAVWFAHDGKRYAQVGVTSPLSDVVLQTPDGSERLTVTPSSGLPAERQRSAAVTLNWESRDSRGTAWKARLDFRLETGAARVAVTYSLAADGPAQLLRFTGPSMHAGAGSFGSRKSFALFPGLEYLQDDERSSSRRDAAEPISLRLVPHPFKVTMPLMAVSSGPYLAAILWDQRQLWDGEHYTLSAQFASPNWYEKRDDHLMRLFLPTPPEWVAENSDVAEKPYVMAPDAELRMKAYVVAEHVADAEPAEVVLRAINHYYQAIGLPQVAGMPRSQAAEIELSRYGFMNTIWDAETRKHRHCVDWAPANSPGFAALMWIDYLLTDDAAAKRSLRDRVELIASQTLAEQAEGGLVSPANCHIMRWEFPFYRGQLAAGLAGARSQVYRAMDSQHSDGRWTFEPDEKHRSLGKFGDAVVGTCARPALELLRYARITADEQALAAGIRALRFIDGYAVPCGAQGWECPLYEPDILAAGLLVPAYVEAYRVTGDAHWLRQASYWAKTGLPFLYAWNRPDTPGMRFASIPVFGTTFFTHSWLGVPVQWNGLVYAYGLRHLAPYDASLPWGQIAEGITVSGTWQQIEEEGKLKGTYCDGWYEYCTDKRGAWINPEDIMVNLFAQMGFDPDVSTAVLPDPIADPGAEGRVHVSSGARVREARLDGRAVSFRLDYFQGETSHTLVTGVSSPRSVLADGARVEQVEDLDAAPQGWRYDAGNHWLFLKLNHSRANVEVRVSAARR